MRYIAFLRAINVGGHTVTMARLRVLFEELGLRDVSTFIASGNVLFETRTTNVAALESRVEAHLHAALGFEAATLIRTIEETRAAAVRAPFGAPPPGEQIADYVGFLRTAPTDDAVARLMTQASSIDALVVHGRELYWRRTGPGAASKLTGNHIERALGMAATLRNLTTVRKLAALP
jgi:uncharacterized protein (DUF1697 family)